ncbi:type I-E CRISPR-associated protein Cse2/CasB [Streptomyces sp. NPDC059193]|uniref:type I-E CRISPR-associated protein Cse2/CasB n=1 Tax=Streptomyces sp. NPDC059193 TaxID=3346763 RepID=UPI0036D03F24
MTDLPDGEQYTPEPAATRARALVDWLAQSVRHRRTDVTGPLRRSRPDRPPVAVPGMPQGVDPEIAIQVARLFVRYHRSSDFSQSLNATGTGDLGQALRRLSLADPPAQPWNKAAEVAMASLLRRRMRLPWRELERALDTMQRARLTPPSWALLISDLESWHVRERSHPRDTLERWASSFYTGHTTSSARRAAVPEGTTGLNS